jgi:hypothetical protein
MASLQAKASAEVEALLAQNSHSSKQVEVLQAELHRIKGGTTLSFAALQNEELQEVRTWSASNSSVMHSQQCSTAQQPLQLCCCDTTPGSM